MTSAPTLLRRITNACANWQAAVEELNAVTGMISADSSLAAALAAAATAGGRSDLSTANFNDLVVAQGLMNSLLAASNGGNVPVVINTGGEVVLAYNRML
jgi:hypothetical protein